MGYDLIAVPRGAMEQYFRARRGDGFALLAALGRDCAGAVAILPPGEDIAAALAAELAGEVMALDERVKQADPPIASRFRRHRHAAVITSLPGIGTLAGRGVPRRYRRRHGRLRRLRAPLHRPKRYNRLLNRAFYTSALISIRC